MIGTQTFSREKEFSVYKYVTMVKLKDINSNELKFVVSVLALIGIFSYFNFQLSFVRARDVQRKNDLKHIASALASYVYDFGSYPESRDGAILACGTRDNLKPCQWGVDGIRDLTDPSYPPYLDRLPKDPSEGRTYVYASDTRNFSLFASLEDKRDAEYNDKIALQGLRCGVFICNFRVGSAAQK